MLLKHPRLHSARERTSGGRCRRGGISTSSFCSPGFCAERGQAACESRSSEPVPPAENPSNKRVCPPNNPICPSNQPACLSNAPGSPSNPRTHPSNPRTESAHPPLRSVERTHRVGSLRARIRRTKGRGRLTGGSGSSNGRTDPTHFSRDRAFCLPKSNQFWEIFDAP